MRLVEGEGISLGLRVVFMRATCHQQQPTTESDGQPFLDCAGEREAAHLILHRLKSGLDKDLIGLPCNTERHFHCDISTCPYRMHGEDHINMIWTVETECVWRIRDHCH